MIRTASHKEERSGADQKTLASEDDNTAKKKIKFISNIALRLCAPIDFETSQHIGVKYCQLLVRIHKQSMRRFYTYHIYEALILTFVSF